MKKILLLAAFLLSLNAFSQNIQINLSQSVGTFQISSNIRSSDIINITATLASLNVQNTSARGGNFITLESEGLTKVFGKGEPALPVFSKLIEIPIGATVQITTLSYDEEIVDLNTYGISNKVMPAQPSLSKNDDPSTVPFYYTTGSYSKNEYINTQIASYEYVGILRSANLGRIEIRPIQYNPVLNKLRVLNNLKIEVKLVGSDYTKSNELKSKYSSPLFDNILMGSVVNYEPSATRATSLLVTYVIISDPMFQSALQPFINWKTQLGYNVIVGYTNNANIGNTTTSIKNYLQSLYNNPPTGATAPQYVLLVGDVAQIPSYNTQVSGENHITDMYYFDYTNDNIPDLFYGRFSASTVAQLQPQIDKTLEYEKLATPDPSYIFRSVLVAGADASHSSTYGNGQINYGTTYYFNANNSITATTYLQPEPSGGNYAARIKADISNGVGFANYSAHCSPSGWANPSFTTSDIPNLTNSHKYGLWVANCCRSARFSETECFAEAALRAVDKGALGYIGATDYSYWSEDFWWAVGFKTVSANPVYDATKLGAFDRLFHINGEPESEWYSTQGQMVIGGNIAVQASTSSMKLYYWEIYHLLGDPSLKMRFIPGENCPSTLSISDAISGGNQEFLANTSISANNVISNGATVHYGAQSVKLMQGFKVYANCSFRADLNGCLQSRQNAAPIEESVVAENTKNEATNVKTTDSKLFKIYPNPNNGVFTLESSTDQIKQIVISDLKGTEIWRTNCSIGLKTIKIPNIAKGIYIVKVIFENDIKLSKIIIK